MEVTDPTEAPREPSTRLTHAAQPVAAAASSSAAAAAVSRRRVLKFWFGATSKLLLLIFGVSLVVFWLVSMSPVDPLQANYGSVAVQNMSAEHRAELAAYWGKNLPFWERYISWLGSFLQGNMGISLRYNSPVSHVIWTKFINSALLLVTAWVLSGVIGFALGVIAGAKRNRIIDRIITTSCYVLASTPTFWFGMLVLMVFAVVLGWFPAGFATPIGVSAADVTIFDSIRHAILPAATLSVVGIANITLHTREKLIEVLETDYFKYSRARGTSQWQSIKRHGIRNIVLPALTLQFASVAEIFGGSILVEQVFSYPGLGEATVTAGLGSDTALLAAISVITATIVFCGNTIATLLYGVVDPKIRRGGNNA
ncbi:MAG: ABC transporter permease [Arcanobacterium sp.]